MAFTPHQRNEIYANISTQVVALAPITGTSLGEVSDNTIFAVSTEIYGLYFEMQNALALLSLDTTAGRDLDEVASEYPNLAPRQQPSKTTGVETVSDTNITKVLTAVLGGGGNAGDTFLNAVSTAGFPASGSLLVGTRGSSVFETVAYSAKASATQFTLAGTLGFSHGSAEPIVLTTVGDRTFPGPFTFKTQPTASAASKNYVSTSSLIIYDGERDGFCDIASTQFGPVGNTPAGTINDFVGSPPFPTARAHNDADLTNGLPLESDADLRQRIRRERQALSSANIDAVTSELFATNFNGQRIKFVQLVEDPDPSLPSVIYIDDGTGFIPTTANITSPIILQASATGGEDHFRIPIDFMPIVCTLSENATRVFANITVERNGTPITQGDDPGDYRVQPNSGILKLVTPLTAGDTLQVTALTYWTDLLGLANKNLYGDRDDRADFPGVIGLGQWVQPRGTAVIFVDVVGSITLDGSRSLTDVVTDITQQMRSYINSLGIGTTVIKNRVQALGFVAGVQDFNLTSLGGISPPVDVIIVDGTLAKSGTIGLT